ncbi:AAA family ATPase [Amycolatopsis sp. EV170708-02-1]|uniref:ATP-binding protein n=1 Tax=Amycolatopsis sp. EV170708-02-1 TaxID=2919322 RepID=UPI001F0C6030|nr:AAA family ATPase [Amycolatopsis sp. EV170708-02-1]UMP00424.1 AAA family ATPase [Amycolatopsis sp. EV170708-02-1]
MVIGGCRRRTSSPILVGREAELRALLDGAMRSPSVLMLEGEAGVGKTRLATELLACAELAGRPVLTAACQPLREPFPYGVVFDALKDVRPARELNPVTGVLAPYLPELAAFLPQPPPRPGDPRAGRHQLFRAVRELLGSLGPHVLLIEDLHWADDGSRRLLRFLMTEPPAGLTLLVTYRREETPGGIPLGSAYRPTPGTAHTLVTLRPLDRDGVQAQVSALLGEANVSAEFAARLHERTAGIPFVVEEIVHAIGGVEGAVHADGATARRLLDTVEVPALLREATVERLMALPPVSRRITDAAAVLGTPSTSDLLAAVAALTPNAPAARSCSRSNATSSWNPAKAGTASGTRSPGKPRTAPSQVPIARNCTGGPHGCCATASRNPWCGWPNTAGRRATGPVP